MTLRALTLFRASFELAFVGVGFVAARTISKRQGLFEFTIQMALRAFDLDVLSDERILCLRMVELKARQQFFPPCRGVAFFAALLERAFMRINMAIIARLELHVFVTRRAARYVWLVALFALNLEVEAGQRVVGLRMIKLVRGFPIREVVAGLAFVSELALVRIFVAVNAVLCQSEKRFRRVLHLDERALIRDHVTGHVALLTGNVCVFAF